MIVDNGANGTRKVNVDYPSNSRNREVVEVREKPSRVVKGKVLTRKKSLGKKFLETFMGEDIDNITSYVLHDVLLPAAKRMIYDMVKGSFKMASGFWALTCWLTVSSRIGFPPFLPFSLFFNDF